MNELLNALTAKCGWDCGSSAIPISGSANVAALGGPGNKIAIGSREKITIFDQGQETLSAEVCTGDVLALAWNVSRNSLLCSDVPGNLMQLEAETLQVTHSYGRLSGGIKNQRFARWQGSDRHRKRRAGNLRGLGMWFGKPARGYLRRSFFYC